MSVALPTCKTCLFWARPEERRPRSYGFAGDEAPSRGQCRRNPPQLFLLQLGLQTLWPMTQERHWCGEHLVEVETK